MSKIVALIDQSRGGLPSGIGSNTHLVSPSKITLDQASILASFTAQMRASASTWRGD